MSAFDTAPSARPSWTWAWCNNPAPSASFSGFYSKVRDFILIQSNVVKPPRRRADDGHRAQRGRHHLGRGGRPGPVGPPQGRGQPGLCPRDQ